MPFHRIVSLRLKDMIKRKEFYTSLVISLSFILIPTFIDLFHLIGKDKLSLYPAWSYFGLAGISSTESILRGVIQIFYILILPFLSSLAYSYCILDEYASGTIKFLLPRTQRKSYYLSGAFMSFIGAFFVILIPMLICQLIFYIAVPAESFRSTATEPLYDNSFYELEYWKNIALNFPYIYNLLYCFIPALVGGLWGLLSFSISLVYRRNRFLILTLPGIIWLISSFIAPLLGHPQWILGYMIAPPIGLKYMKLSNLINSILIVSGVDGLLLFYKIIFAKDEL